jgi:hypothetical protein
MVAAVDNLGALKRLFAQPQFVPDTLALRESVCLAAAQAFGELAAATPGEQAVEAEGLRGFIAEPRLAANPFLRTLANGLLYGATGERAALTEAISAALAEAADDVGVAMNDLCQIDRLIFIDRLGAGDLAGLFDAEARQSFWRGLIARAEQLAGARPPAPASDRGGDARVLILTDQFLQPPHAPTRDALEYAALFQDAGKAVMIASSCALGRQLYSAILPGARCNVNDELAHVRALEFEGRAFAYHQPPTGRFDNETLLQSLVAIEAFDPGLVLVIGQQSLVGELLAASRFVVQYPTVAGLPTAERLRFFMWREPTAEEAELMDRLGMRRNYLFSHHPGFAPPPRTRVLSRAEFGIPEDAFCFAVTRMRLDEDIDAAFAAMMHEVLARAPGAHFVFVGVFERFQARIGADPGLAGSATSLGYQPDILAAYGLCDAYINPTAKGGGSAIVHALSAGLPALSLNRGDAYEAVRAFPVIEDFGALARVAADLAQRGETYTAYRAAVAAKAPSLQSKAEVVEKLLACHATHVVNAGAAVSFGGENSNG